MLRILRRGAIITFMLLVLTVATLLRGADSAFADDCCCEWTCCCDCCCCCDDDPGVPKCSARHTAENAWGCETDLTDCPEGTSPVSVMCNYVSSGAYAMSNMNPPMHPYDAQQLALVVADATANNQLVYARYMICDNQTRVASYHLTPDPGGEVHPPQVAFQECGEPDIQDPLWMRPIDPLCGEPPLRYVHP